MAALQTTATEGASSERRCQSASGVRRDGMRSCAERSTRVSAGRAFGAGGSQGSRWSGLRGVIRVRGAVLERDEEFGELADGTVGHGSLERAAWRGLIGNMRGAVGPEVDACGVSAGGPEAGIEIGKDVVALFDGGEAVELLLVEMTFGKERV